MNKYTQKNIIENIFWIILIIGVCFTFYDLSRLHESITHDTRKIDSLKAQMNVYRLKYDSLQIILTKLDSTVVNQEERVKIVKQSFYLFKTPLISDSDSAVVYIKNFIRE
jgi:hypothetical protein